MRGKGHISAAAHFPQRITPAYAGKSASTRSADRCMQDHPRLCGEKAGGVKMEIDVKGSPPPMRGKGSSVIFDCVISGITPAYAGKRISL